MFVMKIYFSQFQIAPQEVFTTKFIVAVLFYRLCIIMPSIE